MHVSNHFRGNAHRSRLNSCSRLPEAVERVILYCNIVEVRGRGPRHPLRRRTSKQYDASYTGKSGSVQSPVNNAFHTVDRKTGDKKIKSVPWREMSSRWWSFFSQSRRHRTPYQATRPREGAPRSLSSAAASAISPARPTSTVLNRRCTAVPPREVRWRWGGPVSERPYSNDFQFWRWETTLYSCTRVLN